MATLFGPRSTVDLAVPSGWDAAAIERMRLQDGTTIAQVIQMVQAAVNAVNAEVGNDPLIGGLTYQTTDRTVMYREGGTSNTMDVHTEYGLPVSQRGTTEGHMLPRVKRDLGLDWTWDYLNDAIMYQIEADIQIAVDRIRNEYQKAVLKRLFDSTHNTVETSGYDVGLADGNQSNVIWIPPSYDGQTFLSTHTHYNTHTAVSVTNLNLDTKHLQEHGHPDPYWLLISEADRGTFTALTAYIPRESMGVRYGATQDLATVGADFIGVIATDHGALWVRTSNRIPTGYYAVVKSYGNNNARNPLRWWFNPKFGAGVITLPAKAYRQFPIEGLMMYGEYGIGGSDNRTAGDAVYITGGSYTAPTIT